MAGVTRSVMREAVIAWRGRCWAAVICSVRMLPREGEEGREPDRRQRVCRGDAECRVRLRRVQPRGPVGRGQTPPLPLVQRALESRRRSSMAGAGSGAASRPDPLGVWGQDGGALRGQLYPHSQRGQNACCRARTPGRSRAASGPGHDSRFRARDPARLRRSRRYLSIDRCGHPPLRQARRR